MEHLPSSKWHKSVHLPHNLKNMKQDTWYVSCVEQLSRCRRSGLVKLTTWRLATLQEKPGIRIVFFFFQMQLKLFFFQHMSLMTSLLVFSSDKPVNAAMEKVRKAINRHDLFLWPCVTQSIYSHNSKWIVWPFTLGCFVVLCLLCCTIGFKLKVNVGSHCWTSTGPKQRIWKGDWYIYFIFFIYFFSLIVVVLLLLYDSVLNNVLFIHCRKVEQGLKMGVSLNSASVAQSSQYHLIQSKPDYHSLCRQQPLLQAMEIIVSW